ncbi:hypothetical protein RHMOL_Rhmol04G0104800 [Rhododendron molle]|uniref:Uncharacterized protein n=1 Tax=Rhododendron molle TaxID=49168 RepID=A0ACC0P1C1_RHOML|nr:hypothetical protein RHMOL_Rhmol04G0104800 [Rhododendron molle]
MYLHAVLLLFFSWLLLLAQSTLAKNITANIANKTYTSFLGAKPGCQQKCGNLSVPYPFGIGADCSFDPPFNISCSNTSEPSLGGLKVLSISPTQVRLQNFVASRCYDQAGNVTSGNQAWAQLPADWPFTFSDEVNKFTVVGCDDYGQTWGSNQDGGILLTACGYVCSISNSTAMTGVNCPGIGCCQTDIPKGLKNINVSLGSFNNHTQIMPKEKCGYAFVGEHDSFHYINLSDWKPEYLIMRVPIVLDYAIGNQSCVKAQTSTAYLCQPNTSCSNNTDGGSGGYRCSCKDGYKGNPYLSPGCIGLSFGLGFVSLVLIGVIWKYCINRRKLIKQREQNFQQNGGLLMKQKISSINGTSVESSKIFTVEELKKATNNYAEDRILGHGGYGVVYKGILPDQRIVAIKKSKVMDANQVEQFINELSIVTQVNHRNVVMLLGCCFESEVPELVYEYIPNGTVFEHIRKTFSRLTLEHRLRIAAEAAGALSYLHSAASIPIIHRDVKSANILLDANYMAKMADFGASRLVPFDQTQVTTLVQGTLGYLDPEYFHTGQLNEKSDVYSFGVVLAELLTGKMPICLKRSPGEQNLATYFLVSMKENRLYQILEPQVVNEGTLEQLQAIAELVKRCLYVKSEERPTMKEVAMELESFRKYRKDPWVNQQSHEESESLLSDKAPTDIYALSIGPSTGDISGQYSFAITWCRQNSHQEIIDVLDVSSTTTCRGTYTQYLVHWTGIAHCEDACVLAQKLKKFDERLWEDLVANSGRLLWTGKTHCEDAWVSAQEVRKFDERLWEDLVVRIPRRLLFQRRRMMQQHAREMKSLFNTDRVKTNDTKVNIVKVELKI